VYRDPAGAKNVVEAISDKNSDYPMIKELYNRYYGIPKESDFWKTEVPAGDNIHGMYNSGNVLKRGIGGSGQDVPTIEMTNTGEIAPNGNVNIDKGVNPTYNAGEDAPNIVEPGYMTKHLKTYLSEKGNSSEQFLVADKPEVKYDASKFWHKDANQDGVADGYQKLMGEEKIVVKDVNVVKPVVTEEVKNVNIVEKSNNNIQIQSAVKYQPVNDLQHDKNIDVNQNYIQYEESADIIKNNADVQKNYIDLDVTEKK
jgi:hypothetical protein